MSIVNSQYYIYNAIKVAEREKFVFDDWNASLQHLVNENKACVLYAYEKKVSAFESLDIPWNGDVLVSLETDCDVDVMITDRNLFETMPRTCHHKMREGRPIPPWSDAYIQLIACSYDTITIRAEKECTIKMTYALLENTLRRMCANTRQLFLFIDIDRAASTIQRVWKRCVENPYHPIGQRRLMREFDSLAMQ